MMKPEPSEVTWRGALGLGPRKFLNRSSSGEPGGNCGMAFCGGAFKVWLVLILTTVGKSLFARAAKESGAGRAKTAGGAKVISTTVRRAGRHLGADMGIPGGIVPSLGRESGNK